MKTFQSLTTALIWCMIAIAVLSVGMVGAIWIQQEYRKFNAELVIQKQEFIAEQKRSMKEEVNRVLSYIDYKRTTTESKLKINIREKVEEAISLSANIYAHYNDTKSDEEIQNLIVEALRPIRFNDGRGYFYIYDMQGNNILLPHSPHLEGKNLLDLKDSKGQFTIRRIIKLLGEQGESFLRWHWYKPGETKTMSEKIGFNKIFEPYNWWIGTGEYIEDFEKEVQKEALQFINTIRFGEDGYIFVYDFNAITLAHFKKSNIGVNRWNFQDASGQYVVRKLIAISQEEEGGYLEYVGTVRPTTGLPAPKLGYAQAVMDWEWMIGCGIYVDSINATVARQKTALVKEIQHTILFILGVLVIALTIIGFVTRYFARKIIDNISVFSRFFNKASTDAIRIEDESVHFSEFKTLARSANKMIEERNKAEKSLEQLQEKLTRSKKMEALGVLAGGVAHDLNNLLSGVVGYPDLILTTLPADSPYRKYIVAIQESGKKMASIVQDLLTLARRSVLQKVSIRLNDIIDNYLQSPEYQKLLQDNPEIQLKTDLQQNLLPINGSHAHLQAAMMNLIANAAEAQPNGGVIHITSQNICIERKEKDRHDLEPGDYVLISVRDEGMGISENDLERIFEPFFTTKHMGKKSGTGLGMAVVWGTVKDHDGHINVTTEKNLGTTFDLYFPASRDIDLSFKECSDIEDIRGNGETVLVVDDLQEQRDLAQAILHELGYRVTTVSSGEKALEFLAENKVDIVLLDMLMDPGLDGLETFKRILKINTNQKAIIASGYAETDRVKAAKMIGVGQYVKKPYTILSIGQAIRQELQG